MNARLRLVVLSPILLIVLIASAVFPLSARADEATPPPPDAAQASATEPAPSVTAPDTTEVTPLLEVPPADPTEPAPAEVAPPTQATDEVPLDSVPTEVAAENSAPIDLATALPEGTDLVVLDATGEPQPLATVEAAEIISAGDPIWCPGLPGEGGCTAPHSDLASLLTDLSASQPDQDGTIWIQAGSDNSGAFLIDGSTLSTWSSHSLTIQGGWDLSDSGNVSGVTTFDEYLHIVNWGAGISINDVAFTTASDTGLLVETAGPIILDHVLSSGNAFGGASLAAYGENPASVVVTNSAFNDNLGPGLQVEASGDVSIRDTEASRNGRRDLPRGATVFGLPSADGMYILTSGDISLSNVMLNGNTGEGALLSAFGSEAGVTAPDVGVNAFQRPVPIDEGGDVSLSDVTADGNGSDGVFVSATGNVAVVDSQANGNGMRSGPIIDLGAGILGPAPVVLEPGFFGDGFWIMSPNEISFGNVTMNGNAGFGAELNPYLLWSEEGPLPIPIPGEGDVSLINVTADGNGLGGAIVISLGSILVDRSSFSANGGGLEFDGFEGDGLPDTFLGHGLVALTLNGVQVYDSTFSGNEGGGLILLAGADGGLFPDASADSTVQCNTFENNGAPEGPFPSGFGLWAESNGGSTLTLGGNTFGGNALLNEPYSLGWDSVVVVNVDCGGEKVRRPPADTGGLPWNIVNVTPAQQVGLDCAAYIGTVLVLPNGDHAQLPCPFQDQATLGSQTAETLPGPLEGGLTFLSGMDVGLSQNGQVLETLDGDLEVHFVIPEGQQGSQLSILHWNGTEWEQLNGVVSADGFFEAPHSGTGVFVLVSG